MNATEMSKERISAWLDGEFSDADTDAALTALTSAEGRICWHEYHQIGDILRSDELSAPMSTGFAGKMAQRLAAEPYLLVPALENIAPMHHIKPSLESTQISDLHQNLSATPKRNHTRRMWAGVAIAAGLLVVVALPYTPFNGVEPVGIATAPQSPQSQIVAQTVAKTVAKTVAQPVVQPATNLVSASVPSPSSSLPSDPSAREKLISSKEGETEILRDPQMVQYLMEHQRFSPSVHSVVQYARPTTLKKTGTDK